MLTMHKIRGEIPSKRKKLKKNVDAGKNESAWGQTSGFFEYFVSQLLNLRKLKKKGKEN